MPNLFSHGLVILVVVALDVHKLLYPGCIIFMSTGLYSHWNGDVFLTLWRMFCFIVFFFIIFCFINITNQTLDLLLWAIFFFIACYVILRPQSKCETTRIRDWLFGFIYGRVLINLTFHKYNFSFLSLLSFCWSNNFMLSY